MPALTVRDVAAHQQVSTSTVRVWIQSRELRAYRTQGTSGAYRIDPADLEAFIEQRKALRSDPWIRSQPRRRR